MSRPADGDGGRYERCELCVVGAGIGGLSALFAATRYLGPRDRVVVIDRRPRVGGMWNTTYDYVRLHQPHPMFTAGNIAWQGSQPPAHLATGREVLSHLRHCFEELSTRLDLRFYAGYECVDQYEDANNGVVHARCEPMDAEAGQPLRIEARRLVHAAGFGVQPQPPLPLSSQRVRSVSPDLDDPFGPELTESMAPIYIVGGGKTAMDTAYSLIKRFPDKRVRLLIGAGTLFMSRDRAFPTGLSRYCAGDVGPDIFRDLAMRFDGDNELAVTRHFRERYALGLTPECRRHMFGMLSRRENDVIAGGADAIEMDYLVDVVDRNARPTLLLRSGAEREIEPGSWFINATGYFKDSPIPYQPFATPSGRSLAINPRSAMLVLPAYSGYLLVHAAYSDVLKQLPLYELDGVALRDRAKDAFMPTVVTHMLYNLLHLIGAVSAAARKEFGADTARWFPWYRQALAGIRLVSSQRKHPNHLRKNLDRVRERFDVRLGPLA